MGPFGGVLGAQFDGGRQRLRWSPSSVEKPMRVGGEDDAMDSKKTAAALKPESVAEISKLIERYECGPVQLTGTGNALYERHLMFDNVAAPEVVGPREHYEAIAHSVRDILSQRWLRTEQTYKRVNPKRIYYLSMEFLIGRSLANNLPMPRGSTGPRLSSTSRTPDLEMAVSAASRPAS